MSDKEEGNVHSVIIPIDPEEQHEEESELELPSYMDQHLPSPCIDDNPSKEEQDNELSMNENSDGIKSTIMSKEWKTDEREKILLDLYTKSEYQRQMHRLADDYYKKRDTWLHFVPLTFVTFTSGTLGFLSTSDFFNEKIKDLFSLIVGVLAIISVVIQSCAKNYAIRCEMHKTAAVQLKKLSDTISFFQIMPPFHKESGPIDDHDIQVVSSNTTQIHDSIHRKSGEGMCDPCRTLGNTPGAENAEGFRMVYQQILDSCNSTIPIEVSQTFSLIDCRFSILLKNRFAIQKIEETLNIRAEKGECILRVAAYNELYSELSFGWPWISLRPDSAVKRVEISILKTFLDCDKFLTHEYRADRRLPDLCFDMFCCLRNGWVWKCCQRKNVAAKQKDNQMSPTEKSLLRKGDQNA